MVVLKDIVGEFEQQIDEARSLIEATPPDGYRDDIEDERCTGRLLMTDLQRLRKTLVRFGLGVIGPTDEPQYFSESGPRSHPVVHLVSIESYSPSRLPIDSQCLFAVLERLSVPSKVAKPPTSHALATELHHLTLRPPPT